MKVVAPLVCFIVLMHYGCELPDTSASIPTRDTTSIDSIINKSEWEFKKAEERVLYFTNGKSFNTHLFDLRYIGQIPRLDRAPYLVFSGRDCEDCDEQVSIYVHSPDDGELVVELGENRHHYPGVEKDAQTDSVVYKARVFYGEVMDKKKGVIWYQSKLSEKRNWEPDILLIDLSGDKQKQEILKDKGQLQQTLTLLKNGRCTEIKGLDLVSESHPLTP